MTETQKAWIAGIIDGEGCLFCQKDMKGYISPRMTVAMTHRPTLEALVRFSDLGQVRDQARGAKARAMHVCKRSWRWTLIGRHAELLLGEVLPYLVTKKKEAEIFLQLMACRNGEIGEQARQHELADQLKRAKHEGFELCPTS